MELAKSQISSTKLQINPNDQNSKSQVLNIDDLVKSPIVPSPLTGEGQGEGE
jgi:hypothetical protein